MKQNIDLHDFRQAFHNMGRGDQFSYEALEVIFDWIEEYDRDNGSESDLDVIGLCCEICEMTAEEFASSYGYEDEFEEDQHITLEDAEEYLNDNTLVIGTTNETIVFINF